MVADLWATGNGGGEEALTEKAGRAVTPCPRSAQELRFFEVFVFVFSLNSASLSRLIALRLIR